ncbi:MAG: hypothetical protein COU46_02300 [Candidatus Niyogibacteria bacterium CG10_big_fil_rev_8_21_14_0_10_42_19]|uniref:Major facilitator superfamily (MFS) profile domain-containing protein n=1 Tax=Candidatus Niyogibacteria bacterium CG10_big_fil_rev_8_21_14_0_10_42_19 TaxID=1974725 RepID=A0A2H0TFG5_9BACT|nr:MAG: hypothetical protein COU46_02300 [Candidatus Niyogibacteria bacterium CG10_big_fil_rev_8_21_14_0_10_42_19]
MYFLRTIFSFPYELKNFPSSIKRISLVMFLYYLAWGVIDPFFTIYLKDTLGSYTDVAFITAFLYFFSMLISLPIGDLADIVSKKKLIRIFLIFYFPLAPIISFLSTIGHFIFFRIYHAFNATGLWSSIESYVRENSPAARTSGSIGFFNSAVSLASIIGAFAGGFLVARFGIKNIFYFIPVFFIAAFFMTIFLHDDRGVQTISEGLRRLFAKKVFRFEARDFISIEGMPVVTYFSFIYNMIFYGSLVVLPLFSEYLGASSVEIGLAYGLFFVPYLFEAPFSIMADRFDRRKILIFASLASVMFLTFASLTQSIYMLFFISFFLALSFAFIAPNIEGIVTKLMPRDRIGEFNGVYRSVVLLAASIGSMIIGPIADRFSIQTPFLVGAFFMVVFLGCVLLAGPFFESVKKFTPEVGAG